MVREIDEGFYFRPEGHDMLGSPCDETPMVPMDARHSELDVAIGIDRIQEATTMTIRHVRHAWAGLRTFAPDEVPVCGFDPEHPGFFWLAGQGGNGIQISWALARLTAALVAGRSLPDDLVAAGVDPAALSPNRFSRQERARRGS
jgi:D-arginine dehydrogenase